MNHALPPDQSQRDAAIDPKRSVLLRAPAGSGKTGVLLLRYLHCLLTVEQPEQVVAITFTNKAAGEIKERILKALSSDINRPTDNAFDQAINAVVRQVLNHDAEQSWNILENSNRLRIATFDSFCGSLTRRLPLLSGLGAARPLTDTDALYRDAILELFRQLDDKHCPAELAAALKRLLAYGSNRIESLLPLLASLLAKRDQWLEDILRNDLEAMEMALQQVLDSTFSRTLPRLQAMHIEQLVSAFIESSSYQEKHTWAASFDLGNLNQPSQYSLLSQLAQTMLTEKGELYKSSSLQHAKFLKGQPGSDQAKSWLLSREEGGDTTEIKRIFNELAMLPAADIPASSRQLVADFCCALRYLLAHLRLVFEQRGGVDFPEIAQRAIFALRQEDGISDAVLKEDRIQHILVDEMQDTSVSQIQLLRHLCQDWQSDDGRSVFFCGDLQQSIYAFRGSLAELFDELSQTGQFANRPLEQLQLTANFRSSPDLVHWVNRGFDMLFCQQGKHYVAADPQRDNAGQVVIHPQVQAYKIKAQRQAAQHEAANIVSLIEQIQTRDRERKTTSSIAILVRNRRHLAQITPALKSRNIAFSGQDIDTLLQSPAILDFSALLRALWHEADDVAWARLLRAPFIGLGWEDLRQLRSGNELLRDAIMSGDQRLSEEGEQSRTRLRDTINWVEAQPQSRDLRWSLRSAWHLLGGPACVNEAEHRDIERVLALLDEFAPAGLLEDIHALENAMSRLFATPPTASVQLMTIHKSKGLEFDVVILPGLGNRGRSEESPLLVWQHLKAHMVFAPKPQGRDEAAHRYYRFLDQRRRVALSDELDRQLYVALTRAKSELHLFGLASEDKDGELRADNTSFLGRLWPLIEGDFATASIRDHADGEGEFRVPTAPRMRNLEIRLRPGYQPKMLALSPLQRAQRQTENAVLEDNIEQRACGIVFHELMEKLGRGSNTISLFEDSERLRSGVLQRLRHHCHPEPGLDKSATTVLTLLDNTRKCQTGQWILSSYQWQANEQTLRRLVAGQWQTLVMDRIFIESSINGDKCWIIDYKTASAYGNLDDFLQAQADRYRAKMTIYRQALRATGLECPINTALYFPAHQRLVVLD